MRIACKTQRTAEWLSVKCGKVSSSSMGRANSRLTRASGSKAKGDWTAKHDEYVRDLAWELITLTPTEHYVTKPMDIGMQYEDEARVEVWQHLGIEIEETGFVLHPTLDFYGCSPDGYFIKDGELILLEIKVPQLKTHEDYLIDDIVPEEYVPQIQSGMNCLGASRGLFASYAPPDLYPELPEQFRLFLKWCDPIPELHREMEDAAVATMDEATALVQQLAARYKQGKSRVRKQLEDSLREGYLTDEELAILDGPEAV